MTDAGGTVSHRVPLQSSASAVGSAPFAGNGVGGVEARGGLAPEEEVAEDDHGVADIGRSICVRVASAEPGTLSRLADVRAVHDIEDLGAVQGPAADAEIIHVSRWIGIVPRGLADVLLEVAPTFRVLPATSETPV